MVSRE